MLIILFMIFTISSCKKKEEVVPIDDDSTDQIFYDTVKGDTIYIFQMDGASYIIDPSYEIWLTDDRLEDGHFYALTADITYVNGGYAGYYNFPEFDEYDLREVSPYDLGFPDVREKRYGLTLIGDYGEGDIFLHEYRKMALWKDGNWIWHYDRSMDREDGSMVCYREDVTIEEIEEGIEKGILSCEEYFVQPAIPKE